MSDSETRDRTGGRDHEDRYRQIREWATYVRSQPDEDWGAQVNSLVDAQLRSARHLEDERPDDSLLEDSPLLDG